MILPVKLTEIWMTLVSSPLDDICIDIWTPVVITQIQRKMNMYYVVDNPDQGWEIQEG